MRLASSSVIGAALGRPPKSTTVPRLRTAATACWWVAATGLAQMALSAPRPPVNSRTTATTSSLVGSMSSSGANGSAMRRRCALGSLRMTRAPRRWAMAVCRQPMGPAPMTSTVSPRRVPMSSWQACTELSGSASAPSRKPSEAGMAWMVPPARAWAGSTQYSASPPVKAGRDADHGHVVTDVVEAQAAVPAAQAVDVRRHSQVVADAVAA